MVTPDDSSSATKIQISVGLWNVGEKASSDDGKEAIHETIMSIQEPENAEIMLVQEVKSQPVYDAVVYNRNTNINSKYVGLGSGKAKSIVIIYNNSIFEDANRLPVHVQMETRLDVFIVKIGGMKCLLASWHGATRCTDQVRRKKLKETVEYLKRQQEENKCNVVIMGGDFNLNIEKAEDVLTYVIEGDIHRYPKPEVRRSINKPIIDFLVSWPQGKVKTQEVPKPVDIVPQESKGLFDHQLIWHKLEIDVTPATTDTPTSSPGVPCAGCDKLDAKVKRLEKRLYQISKEVDRPIQDLTNIKNICGIILN